MDKDKETTPEHLIWPPQVAKLYEPCYVTPSTKREPVLEEGGEYRIRDKYHQFRLATKGTRDRPY